MQGLHILTTWLRTPVASHFIMAAAADISVKIRVLSQIRYTQEGS